MAFDQSFSSLTQKRTMGSACSLLCEWKEEQDLNVESESRNLYSCVLATETKSKAEKAGSKETWNPNRYLCHDICFNV